MGSGEPRLERHQPPSFVVGFRRRSTDQSQHRGHVGHVLRPVLGERVVAVVRLVGEAEPALRDVDDVPIRVPIVGFHVATDEAAEILPLEPTEQPGQSVQILERVDRREVGRQRSVAERLDTLLVHEAGEQVPDLLAIAPGRRGSRGGRFARLAQDFANVGLGLQHEIHEPADGRQIGTELGGREPRPVHMSEQVVLRTNGVVDGLRFLCCHRPGLLCHDNLPHTL